MLAANNLLELLSKQDDEDYKIECDDYDFGEVLKIFSDDMPDEYRASRKIRYADGTEEWLKFEDKET